MWSLKILTGDLAGQSFELKSGSNKMGRSNSNDVAITSSGISKTHAIIEVQPDKVVVTDNKSTNGTFLDGVAIKSKVVLPGQKIGFHDIICEIVATQSIKPAAPAQVAQLQTPQGQNPNHMEQAMMAYNGNVAQQPQFEQQAEAFNEQQPKASAGQPKGIQGHIREYLDEIILPGVYKLAEHIEFKNLVMMFCLLLVFLVTALSTIPLTRILKGELETSSQDRALTIARLLATKNRASILAGQQTGVQTSYVANESGIKKSFVIDLEGRILAPANMAQTVPNIPFISKARRLSNEAVQQIDDNTIGASVPIKGQTSDGSIKPLAYAVIIYDMEELAVDDGRTFSLFIQTFFIALIVGGIIFFFLYSVILHPITHLNEQVSRTLRDGHSDLELNYNFPELQDLIQNLQSLLARSSGGGGFSEQANYEHERGSEAAGLVNLVGFPAIAVNIQTQIVTAVNPHFQDQIAKNTNWQDIHLNDIMDQALRLNITDLVERCKAQPNQVAQDDIDVDGVSYETNGQAVYGSHEVNYVVVSFTPNEGVG